MQLLWAKPGETKTIQGIWGDDIRKYLKSFGLSYGVEISVWEKYSTHLIVMLGDKKMVVSNDLAQKIMV